MVKSIAMLNAQIVHDIVFPIYTFSSKEQLLLQIPSSPIPGQLLLFNLTALGRRSH